MEKFDCIVVGGGLIGACCTYELLQAGVGKVAWLEQSELGEGTSRAYAGNIFMAAAGYIPQFVEEEYDIEEYGLKFYRSLNKAEPDLNLRSVGSLFIAVTEESFVDQYTAFTNNRTVPDQEILDPNEIEKLCGKINSDAVSGAIYHPSSGWVSAKRATKILARLINVDNGTVLTHTPVTRLVIESGKVTGVVTPHGTIGSERVVLATGAWTNALLHEYGLHLHMIPVLGARVMAAEPGLPVETPVILIKERALYIREEHGGMLWGGGYNAPPRFDLLDTTLPNDLNKLPLDGIWELIEKAKSSADVIPQLAAVKRYTFRYGVPCHTIDRRAMVGPIKEVVGLYIAGGCNEAGVVHAPGFGRLVAEFITCGKTVLTNAEVFAPDRFGIDYNREKIFEAAQHLFNYKTSTPNQPVTG